VGEFLGFGIGENDGEALSIAHSELAKQINSSVKVTTERTVSQQKLNENENISSIYESRAVMESVLSNASDARIVHKKQSGSKTGITVCISKENAAKPYVQRQSLLQDSLEFTAASVLNATRPKQKSEARSKASVLWIRMLANNDLLKSWGFGSDISRAKDLHDSVENNYKDYCKNMKIYWEDSGNECSDASFAVLSKIAKLEKSGCASGLKLSFACAEKCKSVSYGMECSFEPSLAIGTCEGERYSLLRAKEPVTGFDMHSASRAMENLAENLPKAAFFSEWEKEINEWVPKCTE
jgi:hypothetical protein